MARSASRLSGMPVLAASVQSAKVTARSERAGSSTTSSNPSRTTNGLALPISVRAPRAALCIAGRAVRHSERTLSRGGLQFIRQRVVVSAIAVMQEAANGAQKIDGVGSQFLLASAVLPAVFLAIGDLPQPRRRLIVTKPPRSVFDVGLQMINRVSVAR